MTDEKIPAYILAGGMSSRMGRDKLFLPLGGESLLQRIISTCKPHFSPVKIVAKDEGKFASVGCPIVIDNPGAEGPMGGVIAALEDMPGETCFITAADLVDLNSDVISDLLRKYNSQQYLGILEDGGVQPLCGIYHKSALEVLYGQVKIGKFGMTKTVELMNYELILQPRGQWRNINSPHDLTREGIDA